MYYSLDTNLIFGLVNTYDSLHQESVGVVNTYKNKNFKFIWLQKVRTEAHIRFQEKLSIVVVEFLKWQNNMIKLWNDDKALKSFLNEKINELQKTNPYRKNFYGYLHSKVIDFKTNDGNPHYLFSYLSELSSEIPTIIEKEILNRCEAIDLSLLSPPERKKSRELKF